MGLEAVDPISNANNQEPGRVPVENRASDMNGRFDEQSVIAAEGRDLGVRPATRRRTERNEHGHRGGFIRASLFGRKKS